MPRLLIDLSAWARSGHADTRDRWAALLQGDQLLRHPVFAVELLHNAIDPAGYRRLRQDLEKGFDWVWPDGKTADIAALAAQRGVGVLHYDSDYDVIRDRGGEPFDSEWLAHRGSLEGTGESRVKARRAYSTAFGRRLVQLRDDADLEVWAELIDWMDDHLLARGLDVPPPPDHAHDPTDHQRPTARPSTTRCPAATGQEES